MKTSHAQRKGAQQIEQHKFNRSRAGIALRDTGPIKLKANHLLGECPSYNADVCWISDSFEGKLYMVHGFRPGKENYRIPTSDFFCLDTKTMKWRNLTVCLLLAYNPSYCSWSTGISHIPKTRVALFRDRLQSWKEGTSAAHPRNLHIIANAWYVFHTNLWRIWCWCRGNLWWAHCDQSSALGVVVPDNQRWSSCWSDWSNYSGRQPKIIYFWWLQAFWGQWSTPCIIFYRYTIR